MNKEKTSPTENFSLNIGIKSKTAGSQLALKCFKVKKNNFIKMLIFGKIFKKMQSKTKIEN